MYYNDSYDIYQLLYLLFINLPISIWAFYKIKTFDARLYYTLFSLGFYFYSGVGVGYKIGVAEMYTFYFSVFNYVFCTFFLLFLYWPKSKLDKLVRNNISYGLNSFFSSNWPIRVILLYYILLSLQLVIPQFLLFRLFSPPSPDIIKNLMERFSVDNTNIASNFVIYVNILLYPFYLVSIVKYQKKLLLFILLVLLPLYFQYCRDAYIGRSDFLMSSIFIVLCLYKFRPAKRKMIIGITSLAIPFFIVLSFIYRYVRVNAMDSVQNVTLSSATQGTFNEETVYPTLSAKIIDSEKRIDLPSYFFWVATLPLPKFGDLKIDKGLPGYEIAEIVSGRKRGTTNFSVVLAGFLTESIYVYGKSFFWVNAVLTAFFCVFFSNLFRKSALLFPVTVIMSIVIGYNLNRAGIQSALPRIINFNLLLFIFLYYIITKSKIQIKKTFL